MRARWILVGLLGASCTVQRGAPTAYELFPGPAPIETVVVPNPTPPPAPVPEFPAPPEGATAIQSEGGTYTVFVSPSPTTIRKDQPFQFDVWVTDRTAPTVTLSNVELAVSAAMPETAHASSQASSIERASDEHFVVKNLLLDMSGRWELHFDITRAAITERAQVEVVLE